VSGPDLDVAIVGDGPAGAALAAACRSEGLAAVLVGTGVPWEATYGSWCDDVPGVPSEVFSTICPQVLAFGERRHELHRPYGVFDNDALRAHLLDGVEIVCSRARGHQQFVWGNRVLTDHGGVDARVVVDAAGFGGFIGAMPGGPSPAWQTAYGVVLAELPSEASIEPDAVTLMDFRNPSPSVPPSPTPTFCYVVPVRDGWLVEETVLAARPAVVPSALRSRLEHRLGLDGAHLVATALRTEMVRIPMGGPISSGSKAMVRFGAAAGFVHPATGYSVAASLRAAPRVAAAIADGVDPSSVVWPLAHRRARVLHHYGLERLLQLDGDETRSFFDAFFDLPADRWTEYLRIDTTPAAVASVMRGVFSAAPWSVRRRLMAGNPLTLAHLLQR
jgi:lycopene beta-cyclase